MGNLRRVVEQITAAGAAFCFRRKGGVDTISSTGKLMLVILGAVASLKKDIRRERQRDGIEKALRSQGLGPTAIAWRPGVSRASVYRLASEAIVGR